MSILQELPNWIGIKHSNQVCGSHFTVYYKSSQTGENKFALDQIKKSALACLLGLKNLKY